MDLHSREWMVFISLLYHSIALSSATQHTMSGITAGEQSTVTHMKLLDLEN